MCGAFVFKKKQQKKTKKTKKKHMGYYVIYLHAVKIWRSNSHNDHIVLLFIVYTGQLCYRHSCSILCTLVLSPEVLPEVLPEEEVLPNEEVSPFSTVPRREKIFQFNSSIFILF